MSRSPSTPPANKPSTPPTANKPRLSPGSSGPFDLSDPSNAMTSASSELNAKRWEQSDQPHRDIKLDGKQQQQPLPHQSKVPEHKGHPSAITGFNAAIGKIPGYIKVNTFNAAIDMMEVTNGAWDQRSMSLSNASVSGEHIAFASDDPDSSQQYIMCSSFPAVLDTRSNQQIIGYSPIKHHIRDLHWIVPGVIVCAAGNDGLIQVYNISADFKFSLAAEITNVHSGMIRELAFNKFQPNLLASGGFDQTLCLSDLNSPTHKHAEINLGQTIGSVKWPILNQSYCVSCTTDNGIFRMFDIRTNLSNPPPFMLDTKKDELFAHERYSDFYVLLGFGDGEIHSVDMRTGRTLNRTSDPFCEGIGSIAYNHRSGAFVTSGYSDFTVWKHEANGGIARVWSHSKSGNLTIDNRTDYSCHSFFVGDNLILNTDSVGSVGLYRQNFHRAV